MVVATRRPSFEEYIRTVTPLSEAETFIRMAAGQSLPTTSSGPPHETVASRPGRVARDPELVGRVLHQVEPREEGRVEDRGGHLAHAAADGVLQLAGVDLGRGHEAAGRGALAQGHVEREAGVGRDDRAVQDLGRALDVGDARLAAGVGRGELARPGCGCAGRAPGRWCARARSRPPAGARRRGPVWARMRVARQVPSMRRPGREGVTLTLSPLMRKPADCGRAQDGREGGPHRAAIGRGVERHLDAVLGHRKAQGRRAAGPG